MLLAICLVALLLMLDGELSRIDGVILLTGLVLMLYGMVRIGRLGGRTGDPMKQEYAAEIPQQMPTSTALLWFIFGLVLLLISSRMLVWGAVQIATAFGVSDLVIGLTIIALGTSLPEMAAGVASALKGEHDIAIGNVIGSNMYNLLAVLSMPALLAPGSFAPEVLMRDMTVMIGLTLAMFFMSFGFRSPGRINRFEGLLLLLAFIGYQGLLFISTNIT
jgi:cation:H+ antiporter